LIIGLLDHLYPVQENSKEIIGLLEFDLRKFPSLLAPVSFNLINHCRSKTCGFLWDYFDCTGKAYTKIGWGLSQYLLNN